jgi:hypothetical protein
LQIKMPSSQPRCSVRHSESARGGGSDSGQPATISWRVSGPGLRLSPAAWR